MDLFYNWTFIDNEYNFHNQQYLQESKQHTLTDFNRQLDIIGMDLISSSIKKVIGTYIVTVHNPFDVIEKSIILTTDTKIVPQNRKYSVFEYSSSAELITKRLENETNKSTENCKIGQNQQTRETTGAYTKRRHR